MVEADAEEYGHVAAAVGLIPRWHHVDCFIQAMPHLEVSNITANNLTGFTKLKKPDKEMLAQKLGGSATAKKTRCVCVLSLNKWFPQETVSISYRIAQIFDSGKFLTNQGWEKFDK